MSNVFINSEEIVSKIKPMNCVNNFPSIRNAYDQQFKDLEIPYSRLHDTVALNPHLVDVDSIFPNFDADENDENSYDFAFTDYIIKKLINLGTKPFYRLGSSIETLHWIKTYHIYPPFKPYYVFKAFAQVKKNENQVECVVENDKEIRALASCKDGNGAFIIVNDSKKRKNVNISGIQVKTFSLLSKTKDLKAIAAAQKITLNPYEVVLGTF